ncbi:AAA family ATPase, partial [Streptobacillus moniliformis]|uniref:AAA family ATPase n=1 Tax=Streptobacillus moniliformis TaxID=34105 RepID=UPI000AC74C05
IAELNVDEIGAGSTDEFNAIHYIFIDDPVTALDSNHLIQLAFSLREAIDNSKADALRFIITTHHALFYHVLVNEFKSVRSVSDNRKEYSLLEKNEGIYF